MQSSAADVQWRYFSFVPEVSPATRRGLIAAIQIRFNFAGGSAMQSTVIHWTMIQIRIPSVYIIATSKFPIMSYKPCWHNTITRHAGYVHVCI